jgi:hypothetical protein
VSHFDPAAERTAIAWRPAVLGRDETGLGGNRQRHHALARSRRDRHRGRGIAVDDDARGPRGSFDTDRQGSASAAKAKRQRRAAVSGSAALSVTRLTPLVQKPPASM